MPVVSFSKSEGVIYCHTRPSVLPITFMMTAESAGGRATKGEEKCAAANTTPKDEFCIPTCNPEKKRRPLNIFRVIIFKLSLFIVILKDNQVGSI
jgi:hypothetical protein